MIRRPVPLDDLTRLRDRQRLVDDGLSRRDWDSSPDGSTLLARTKTLATYPTAARRFFACEPATVLGQESEGEPGVITPGAGTVFAFNLGNAVPPSGTTVLLTFAANRWVFRHDG